MVESLAKDRETTVFGRRLREIREAKGLSLRDLGELVGIAHQTIRKYESGENLPNWETVEKLADALAVSTEEFRNKQQ